MLAVALGAFGAHSLKSVLTAEHFATFETAVKYQFFHTLAIFGVAALMHFGRKQTLVYAGWLFTAGIALFSGSHYILSTDDIHGMAPGWLGPITPIGGLLLIAGWGYLFASTFYHYERHYKEEK